MDYTDDDEVLPPDSVIEEGALAPDDDDDDFFSDEDEDAADSLALPFSHDIKLNHGDKPVSSIAIDPAGSRMLSGGFDYQVKFWDFNGMDQNFRSFRQFEPVESHPVRCLAYSTTGDMIAISTGSAQAMVIDRDGREVMECYKGDSYLFDLARTHGHVAQINECCWHPSDRSLFLTCSNDGTLRLWHIEEKKKSKVVAKCRGVKGRRPHVLCCAYSPSGKLIVAGTDDGFIHIFQASEKIIRLKTQFKGHEAEVTCVQFSRDNRRIISRSRDGSLCMWDMYDTKKPKLKCDELPCFFSNTSCCFSPDEKYILTGTSSGDGKDDALLVVLDATTLERVQQLGVEGRGVIRCIWHYKINQIILSCADGSVKVLYDPKTSTRGALLCASKAARKPNPLDVQFGDPTKTIINPNSLRMFREDVRGQYMSARKRQAKARKDPIQSKKPQPPMEEGRGVGRHGVLLKHTKSLSQYIAKRTAYDPTKEQDPREAILKYADEAEKNPFFVAPAYAKTQPKAVYDFGEHPEEQDEKPTKKAKYDPNVRRP